MSKGIHKAGNAVAPTNIVDVPRLLFLAAACKLWLREYSTVRRHADHVVANDPVYADQAVTRVVKLPVRQNRWDWSASGAPVMR